MRKPVSTLLKVLAAVAAIGAMAACGPQEDPVIAVSGITLSQSSVSIEEGATVSLTANVSPSNATDKTVTWSSSNTGVASVAGGVVTGVAEGSATVTATAGGKSAKCEVKVTAKTVAVTGVSLNKTELSLYIGETFQLEATVSPSNATDKAVTWSSSDSGVATVSGGTVKAMAKGTATITATAGGKSASCTVTCKERPKVQSISFGKDSYVIPVGTSEQLTISYAPADAVNTTFIWTVSAPEAARVDESGVFTALAPGEVTVTVTADNGVSASVKVTIPVPGSNEEYGYEELN